MTTGSLGKDRNSIICTACGAANSPGSRFCERCGTRLPQPGVNQPTRAMPAPTPPIPPAEMPSPRPVPRATSSAPDATPARAETAQEPPPGAGDAAPDPPAASDSPTVTIELAPTREITRDAPTQTFALPGESRPASDMPAATPTPPGAPPLAGDQPTQIGSGWNYRSWTPAPGQGVAPEQGGAVPPAAQPREPDPATTEIIQVVRPTGAGTAPQERVSVPEESSFAAPTTAPLTYPSGGTTSGAMPERPGQPSGAPVGGAPPPTGYMANAGQYPAPAIRSNNRTLWIILGVVGGLVLLCIIICVLIVVVAAVGASSTTAVATSVATATRR